MADKGKKAPSAPASPPPEEASAPGQAVVTTQPLSNELTAPVPMQGGRRPSDPTDFTAHRSSLIYGEGIKLPSQAPAPPKKFENDFWICNGIMMVIGIIFLVIALVVRMTADKDKVLRVGGLNEENKN